MQGDSEIWYEPEAELRSPVAQEPMRSITRDSPSSRAKAEPEVADPMVVPTESGDTNAQFERFETAI